MFYTIELIVYRSESKCNPSPISGHLTLRCSTRYTNATAGSPPTSRAPPLSIRRGSSVGRSSRPSKKVKRDVPLSTSHQLPIPL